MSLSISNFKFGFVFKVLFVCIAMMILYAFFIFFFKPKIFTGMNQWQDNIIRAENYIYEEYRKPIVIAGSSLSARLRRYMLNESYGNLSFAGSGAATGLELVLKNPSKPKIILIEINVIRERDEHMIRDLFSPFLFYLKQYFPFLRQKYQPATVLANSFLKEDKSLSSNVDESVFKIGFDNQKKGQENIPDASYIDKQIVEISSLIRSAENDHVKVIFYEMPVHPDLAKSRSSVFIREKMLTAFPPNKYDWLPHPEDSKYQTTDGVHLTGASAIVFAQWLQNEISHKQAK